MSDQSKARVSHLSLVQSPEQQPRRLPILSVTSANRYRSCPRSYYFANVLRRVPRRIEGARRFGTLFHLGLEEWWRRLVVRSLPEERLEASLRVMRTSPGVDPYDLAKAEVLLRGYETVWGGEELEVLGVEQEFEGDLRNPMTSGVSRTFRIGGRMDAIVRKPDGSVWVVEHKTSSEDIDPGTPYRMRLELDPQVSTYLLGARLLGYKPAGVMYDVIKKPEKKPLEATPVEQRKYTKGSAKEPPRLYANQREHGETPAEYADRILDELLKKNEKSSTYQRFTVERSPDDECEAAYDVWTTSLQIRESVNHRAWPKYTKSCYQYRQWCDYFAVCTKQAFIEDDHRFKSKEKQ